MYASCILLYIIKMCRRLLLLLLLVILHELYGRLNTCLVCCVATAILSRIQSSNFPLFVLGVILNEIIIINNC